MRPHVFRYCPFNDLERPRQRGAGTERLDSASLTNAEEATTLAESGLFLGKHKRDCGASGRNQVATTTADSIFGGEKIAA